MLHLSHAAGAILFAGGVVACLISVGAVRLVMLNWDFRVQTAASKRIAHVTWRPFDTAGVAFWSTIYAAGSLATLWGLWVLGG